MMLMNLLNPSHRVINHEKLRNLSDSGWMKYGFMEKQYFIERCLQNKYRPYINISFNGEILRAEPIMTYEEICHECK